MSEEEKVVAPVEEAAPATNEMEAVMHDPDAPVITQMEPQDEKIHLWCS